MAEKKKSFIKKRKEAEQMPNVVKQFFPSALTTLEFANLEGRLAISGQDAKEVISLMRFASGVPAVAVFMEIEKKGKKDLEERKGVG